VAVAVRGAKGLEQNQEEGGRRKGGTSFGDMIAMNRAKTNHHSYGEDYPRIFDNSPMGIFRCTAEGSYVAANPAYIKMHGFDSAEELMTAAACIKGSTYVNAADLEKLKEGMYEGKNIEGFETERYRKDGERIWVSVSAWPVKGRDGHIECYEGTCIDITRRKLAEEELRTSREKYQTLVEWSSVLIWEVDVNGIVTYIIS